ncbi:MAG: DUF4345 domain-containing protein [Dokdonella sp.]|uniref:DUF4345 domain-containing protein n=1 Tax=Dokdonella sp. TaxID=2291710 RepID=UPI0032633536
MATIYLYFNAFIYAALALWCTLAPTDTAVAVGYETLSRSGMSEYLVVYGGLEFGLALFFVWCVHSGMQRAGVAFSLALYVPIVLYRFATVIHQWPVASITLGTGILEIVLLLGAIVAWRSVRA